MATVMSITEQVTCETVENICLRIPVFAHIGHEQLAITLPFFPGRLFLLNYIQDFGYLKYFYYHCLWEAQERKNFSERNSTKFM